jgi:hypothetical protein
MRAIVIKQYGGPEVLALEERPAPDSKPGHVIIEVTTPRSISAREHGATLPKSAVSNASAR